MQHESPLMLSVSGLRGIVGGSLTPLVAVRYGCAIGLWLREQTTEHPPRVVVGRDSRPSGLMIEQAVQAGLISVGCQVVSVGILSTPGVAVMVEHACAEGGVVITASHNPAPWNGIKVLTAQGVSPPPEQARRIIELFEHEPPAGSFVSGEQLQSLTSDANGAAVHVDRVIKNIDVPAIRRRKFKVVIDSVCGAGGAEAALLLDQLQVQRVHLHAMPTGRFPHAPEPLEENLRELAQVVQLEGADVGFAQDPDADRLVIIDNRGRYIGEEYTLALTCWHVLNKAGRRGATVATNLSTSRMIDDIAQAAGATALRTPVGEAHVAQAMREHQSLFGGEGNGGVIWPPVAYVRDSIGGMGLILEMLSQHDQPLSALVQQIPAYVMIKHKQPVDAAVVQHLTARMKKTFPKAKLNQADGVRVDLPEGWVHVRASNTEPILRIIAEAGSREQAQQLVERVRAAIE